MTYFNGKPSGKIPKGYSVVDANPASRMVGPATTPTTGVTNPTNVVATGGVDTSLTRGVDMPRGVSLIAPSVPTETPTETPTKTPTETTTTTTPAVNAAFMGDKGQGVNSYGGSITSSATGAVTGGETLGVGGFTLNPDGTVTANTVDRTVMTVAGMVNPLLGMAARINNALATTPAKQFSAAIADTMGTNVDTTQPAVAAGPVSVGGTGGTAATAASLAASEASSTGMSDAAIGAASQAAAEVIVKGGSASEAAQAGRDASTSTTINEAAQAGRDAEAAPEVSTSTGNIVENTNVETNKQPTEIITTATGGVDTTVGSGNDGGDIYTTVGSGNDGGDEGAGTGEAGGGGSDTGAGDIGGSTDVGSGEEEYAGGASMTAVDALGGSFAAKPMEMLQAERKGIKVEAAKGGLITRRVKKTTSAQKRGIASRK